MSEWKGLPIEDKATYVLPMNDTVGYHDNGGHVGISNTDYVRRRKRTILGVEKHSTGKVGSVRHRTQCCILLCGTHVYPVLTKGVALDR